jgi:hypothetical protein
MLKNGDDTRNVKPVTKTLYNLKLACAEKFEVVWFCNRFSLNHVHHIIVHDHVENVMLVS